jgi:exopolyphosphatase/guanosine-5'-triphosphate,3'-diphosphate pyrophosphatase
MRDEAGLELGVISGMEEARLIYLGVSSGIDLGGRTTLFIDIGGGSSELGVRDQDNHAYLDSLKLGAIRMTTMFIPEKHKGPVDDPVYNKMKRHVRSLIVHTVKSVSAYKLDLCIGSSGSIINLAEMAVRGYGGKPGTVKLTHLKKLTSMLRSLPLEQRRSVPGINPDRADIIIGGASILETLMEELKIEEIMVSDRGAQNGLLVDYISRIEGYPQAHRRSVRETSVLQLGRSCSIDEHHAETVVSLALDLFDSAKAIGLHDLGKKERELLKYAAYLRDVGDFISFTNHHAHSYYIVRNADLLGFESKETALMADLVRYHRKRPPRKKDPEMEGLDQKTQDKVIILSAFMRLAETLDRSHANLVTSAELRRDGKDVVLRLDAEADISLEVWGVEADSRAFKRAFDRDLRIEVHGPSNGYALHGQ